MRETLRSLANSNQPKAHLVPFHTPTQRLPERTTSLQSATDDNGTPITWTLVLFQQAIDRQDRTLQSRRTLQLYWNHWSTPWIQEYPHYYYRTRTHRTSMTCLVGYTPLRLLHTLQDTISQTDTSQETSSHRAPLDTNIVDTNDISPGYPPLS